MTDDLRACLVEEFGVRASETTIAVHFLPKAKLRNSGDLSMNSSVTFLNEVALYRLRAPEVLPNVHRMLDMDTDTIINGDLVPLFQTELKHPVGVVASPYDFYWTV